MPELSHLYTEEQATKYGRPTQNQILMQELKATGMVFKD